MTYIKLRFNTETLLVVVNIKNKIQDGGNIHFYYDSICMGVTIMKSHIYVLSLYTLKMDITQYLELVCCLFLSDHFMHVLCNVNHCVWLDSLIVLFFGVWFFIIFCIFFSFLLCFLWFRSGYTRITPTMCIVL